MTKRAAAKAAGRASVGRRHHHGQGRRAVGRGQLVVKVGDVFCSRGRSKAGGRRRSRPSPPGLTNMAEITDGSPRRAGTLAGDGSWRPRGNEPAIARFQGRHVAEITRKLVGG
jgi:hypothetical protein